MRSWPELPPTISTTRTPGHETRSYIHIGRAQYKLLYTYRTCPVQTFGRARTNPDVTLLLRSALGARRVWLHLGVCGRGRSCRRSSPLKYGGQILVKRYWSNGCTLAFAVVAGAAPDHLDHPHRGRFLPLGNARIFIELMTSGRKLKESREGSK